jgi:hypothetical protein
MRKMNYNRRKIKTKMPIPTINSTKIITIIKKSNKNYLMNMWKLEK